MQFLGKRIQIHLTYYKNVQNKYSCGSSHSFYQPKGMLCAIFVLLLPIFVLVIFYGIHRQLPSFLRFCALWPMDCCSLKWCVKITLAAAVRQFGQNQGLNAPKCAICFAGACYLGHLSLDLPAKPSFWIYNASMQAETLMGDSREVFLCFSKHFYSAWCCSATFILGLFIYHFKLNLDTAWSVKKWFATFSLSFIICGSYKIHLIQVLGNAIFNFPSCLADKIFRFLFFWFSRLNYTRFCVLPSISCMDVFINFTPFFFAIFTACDWHEKHFTHGSIF